MLNFFVTARFAVAVDVDTNDAVKIDGEPPASVARAAVESALNQGSQTRALSPVIIDVSENDGNEQA